MKPNAAAKREPLLRRRSRLTPAMLRRTTIWEPCSKNKASSPARRSTFAKRSKSSPLSRLARFHLGRIYANQRRFPEAIEQFHRAVEGADDESRPAYLYALGATQARAGDLPPPPQPWPRPANGRLLSDNRPWPRPSIGIPKGCGDERLRCSCFCCLPAAAIERPAALFHEQETGLHFTHRSGASGKFYMTEIMGAGVALFDYDNDGDLDVFFVQSAGESKLFRN